MRFHLDLADGCKFSMRPDALGLNEIEARAVIAGEADPFFSSQVGERLHNHARWLRHVQPESRDMKRNALAVEAKDPDDIIKPGAYRFFVREGRERTGIRFGCPCGCGLVGSIYFEGEGDDGGPEWKVEGEWPKATLTPSIGFFGQNSYEQGHHWHGFLRDGVFEEC